MLLTLSESLAEVGRESLAIGSMQRILPLSYPDTLNSDIGVNLLLLIRLNVSTNVIGRIQEQIFQLRMSLKSLTFVDSMRTVYTQCIAHFAFSDNLLQR